MLYTNKVIINLKWRKCNNFFKWIIKENVKYTKSLNFLYLFSLFHFILRNHILTQHGWKVVHDLIFTWFDYLTKTSIINLKEVIVESINYLGWELNLSIRPLRFFLNTFKKFQWTQTSERDLVERRHIQSKNTKIISSQLFGCSRAKLGPLGRGYPDHLMFITNTWTLTKQTGPLNRGKCPEMP